MQKEAGAPTLLGFTRSLRGLALHREDLECIQAARVRLLLEHAYANVSYYRKLFDSVGFHPRHFKRLQDLRAIPVTTRRQLRTVPREAIVSRRAWSRGLRSARTSGTSGMPLTVYRTRRENLYRQLLTLRTFRHYGMHWQDRLVTISRSSTGARSPLFRRSTKWPLWNLCLFEELERMIDLLLTLKPSVIYGFATNLAIIADLLIRRGIHDIRPRILATSSDLLTAGFRRVIRQAFGVNPLDIYSCTETGTIGWQCEARQGFHLNADWLIAEVLRGGEPAQSGDYGEVVVTPLFRYAMPLIRYSPGDLAQAGDAACSCGLILPTLGKLDGRSQNIVPLPNGRVFVGFSEIMSYFSEIARYQIVQEALDSFTVKIVPGQGYSSTTATRIARDLAERLGEGIHVHVENVDFKAIGSGTKTATVVPLHTVDFGQSA
jgi:phenylacetate-CoA ligase